MANPDLAKTAVIDLDFPFEFDGETVSKITMRRPKMGDNIAVQKMKGDDFTKGIALLVRLCEGMSPEHLAELDELDASKLNDQLEAFRGGGKDS